MTIRIEPIDDAHELARIHAEILEPSFPDTELVTVADFVAGSTTGAFDVLAARTLDDGAVLGVIVGERHGAGVLVDWLAVAPTTRGGGVGRALLTAGVERWLADGGALLVLGEVERPDLFAAHPQYGDPARRLAFYERLGAAVLDMPYYQPPIRDGAPRLRGLMLTVLAAADRRPAPRLLDAAETLTVRDVLEATMGAVSPGDEETARVFAAVEHPDGLRLLPLAEYRRTPISRERL